MYSAHPKVLVMQVLLYLKVYDLRTCELQNANTNTPVRMVNQLMLMIDELS